MILITAGKARKLSGDYSLYVSYCESPLFKKIIENQPRCATCEELKCWEIGIDCLRKITSELTVNNFQYDRDLLNQSLADLNKAVEKEANKKLDVKSIDTTEVRNQKYKLTPRSYQYEGIATGLSIDKFLLGDDQGLGKTLQAINIARLKKVGKHCLIITGYDILQYNWVMEIEKHSFEQSHVLGAKTITKGKNKGRQRVGSIEERIDDLKNIANIEPYFIIMNVSTLRHTIKDKVYNVIDKVYNTVKQYPVAELIEMLCTNGEIGRVIFDEAQVLRNNKTDQSIAIQRLQQCKYKMAMTGTPLMNKHSDLYPILRWLGKINYSYWDFVDKFCITERNSYGGRDIIGNKNPEELNQILNSCMLRRKKEDVTDLPDKIYIDDLLEMSGKQENLYVRKKEYYKNLIKNSPEKAVAILSSITALRKITAHPILEDENSNADSVKFIRIKQLIDDITERGEKAIIFSIWESPLLMLETELAKYKPLVISGQVKDKMERVNKFQNDPEHKVILGTIGAMGTGVTLTAANNVIFLDEPWNRAIKDQCVDRAHRIGTTKTVTIYTLMCNDTVDIGIHKLVLGKGLMQDKVVDGLSEEELLDILEGKYEDKDKGASIIVKPSQLPNYEACALYLDTNGDYVGYVFIEKLSKNKHDECIIKEAIQKDLKIDCFPPKVNFYWEN